MGIDTSIEWADSTHNLQMGCDGCELWVPDRQIFKCYAGNLTSRYGGKSAGYPLAFDRPQLFLHRLNDLLKWPDLTGRDRPEKPWLNGLPRMVFLDDMGDTFTESLPYDWLGQSAGPAFGNKFPLEIMAGTPHMYMLLTKRAGRMSRLFKERECPPNFILGVSVTDASTLPRLRTLMGIECGYRFVSYEPAWGPVNLVPYLAGLNLVIGGGESGPNAEPCKLDWLGNALSQSRAAGVPFFMKQLGSNPQGLGYRLMDRKGGNMSEWPEGLRVREFLERKL